MPRTAGDLASSSITAAGANARTVWASITASGAVASTAGAPASATITAAAAATRYKDCGGAGISEHNRIRSRCKDCVGIGMCKHCKGAKP